MNVIKNKSKIIKIFIKDKVYESKKKLSDFDILYISTEMLDSSSYNSNENILYVTPKVKNFKILLKLVDTREFKQWYLDLIEKSKKNKKEIIKKEIKTDFLYPFQRDAVNKILNCKYNGFLLGNSMGTGKTITSLSAALEMSEDILIICPSPLIVQWQKEIFKWFKKKSVILSIEKNKRLELYKTNKIKIKIISYDTFKIDYENKDLKLQIKNNILIADESSKIKKTKLSKKDKLSKIKKVTRYGAIKHHNLMFKFKMFLSGTPVSKGLDDIHNVIQLIDRNIVKYIGQYKIYEEVVTGWGNNAKIFPKFIGYKNLDKYVNLIKPVYERQTLESIGQQMPKKTIKRIDVNQVKSYHKTKDVILSEYNMFTGFSLLCMLDSGMVNLRKSESEGVELIEDDLPANDNEQKIIILKELIGEINDKTLIFTRFIQSTKLIKSELEKEFKNKKIVIVDSSTKNKDEIKTKFNEGDIDIVIATETWAEGISLHEIDYLINYDISPSIDKYLQKNDRIYRINSTRPKFIYNLVGDIIEQHVMDILEEKLIIIEKITEGKAGIISDSDIKKEVMKKLGFNNF